MADTLLNGNLRKSQHLSNGNFNKEMFVRAPPTQDRNTLRQETLLKGIMRVCCDASACLKHSSNERQSKTDTLSAGSTPPHV